MGSFLENDAVFCRNSIKYLHEISLLPELNTPALKSIYSTKRRLMELRKSILLPSSCTRTSVTCQRCLINLKEGPANYRVIPAKKQTAFVKKVLLKKKSGKPLTKYQQKYFERMNNFFGNHLAITCKFCKNEALIKMVKPKKPLKQKVTISIKAKRKKKKDKYCGLKKEVVMSYTSQNKKTQLENTGGDINLKKKKKQSKLNDLNSEVITSLTTQNIRNLDTWESTESKRRKIKMKTKEVKLPEISKENLKKNKYKLQKKKQNMNKLSEFLNKSSDVKNPIASLKQFLQGL